MQEMDTDVFWGDEEALSDAGYWPGRAACASSVDKSLQQAEGLTGHIQGVQSLSCCQEGCLSGTVL